MDDDSTRQSVLFSDLLGKALVAKFDQEHASSDGGATLLQACDRHVGLTDASRARSATRSGIWCANVCMRSPAVTRMPMMRADSGPTPSRSCSVVGIGCVARTLPRNRRSRA